MSAHPTNDLNDVVHQRHRLGILTIAAESKRVEFGYLREALDLPEATSPGTSLC